MLFTIIAFVFLVLILLLLLFLILIGVFKTPNTTGEYAAQLEQTVSLQAGWSTATPVKGNDDRGKCQLYRTFSQETEIVDQLRPIVEVNSNTKSYLCLDGFVQALQKVQATCQAAECLGLDGNLYYNGETYYYYNPCQSLPRCQNIGSAIILNFGTTIRGQLIQDARCLLSNLGTSPTPSVSAGVCPSFVTLTNNAFLNIDQQQVDLKWNLQPMSGHEVTPLTKATVVRIRFPGTSYCLLPNSNKTGVYVATCSRSDQGYVWYYTPQISNETNTYPPQLLVRPSDLETAFQNTPYPTPASVISYLSRYSSIQSNNNEIVLKTYANCGATVQCQPNTQIIPATSWNTLTAY